MIDMCISIESIIRDGDREDNNINNLKTFITNFFLGVRDFGEELQRRGCKGRRGLARPPS